MTAKSNNTLNLGFRDSLKILLPYIRENFIEQLKNIWFIIIYLMLFQTLILNLPIVYASMIGIGVVIVMIGLMFFMEGLRLGLMPLGETIGAVLPRNTSLMTILIFGFFLGIGVTFAEPAIGILRLAGVGIQAHEAPLLYSMLNDFSDQLVLAVGIGVGLAVSLGILRFFYGWSLKTLLFPLILSMLIFTVTMHNNAILQPLLGLAWDCGAVTTGPVTVPLVLALGIGVCRIVGDEDSHNAGFGIVTLASLFPILLVLSLGLYHFLVKDYYGEENYQGDPIDVFQTEKIDLNKSNTPKAEFTEKELADFIAYGFVPKDHKLRFEGGKARLENGRIVLVEPTLIIEKIPNIRARVIEDTQWDPQKNIYSEIKSSVFSAIRAIVPLCLFLFLTLKWVLPDKYNASIELKIGLIFALIGMTLFVLGISLGLTPLGAQLGSNVPGTFANIVPWGMSDVTKPLFESTAVGKSVAVIFGFLLGYGATLAEPALNALGNTVEQITVGSFRKRLLMQSVAIGVGLGIAVGVYMLTHNIPLTYFLIPPYLILLILTSISSEDFVNFAWDSAGVTTGPITVPLVLAMGLGIGANIPGLINGFGILALASVGPIITVLTVGLLVSRARKQSSIDIALEEST